MNGENGNGTFKGGFTSASSSEGKYKNDNADIVRPIATTSSKCDG